MFLSKYVSVRSAAAGRKGEGTELARLRRARSREQARPAVARLAELTQARSAAAGLALLLQDLLIVSPLLVFEKRIPCKASR